MPERIDMESVGPTRLIRFLQEEVGLSLTAIAIAKRTAYGVANLSSQEQSSSLLPIILWQHGIVTLEQLDRILDWLETA